VASLVVRGLVKGSTGETPEAVEMFRHTSKRQLVVDTRRSASAFHASSHDDCVSTRKPHMRFLSHFHGRKLRTPASVETALLSDSLDVKKLLQTFVIDCLVETHPCCAE
jgi:hypothetical protein